MGSFLLLSLIPVAGEDEIGDGGPDAESLAAGSDAAGVAEQLAGQRRLICLRCNGLTAWRNCGR